MNRNPAEAAIALDIPIARLGKMLERYKAIPGDAPPKMHVLLIMEGGINFAQDSAADSVDYRIMLRLGALSRPDRRDAQALGQSGYIKSQGGAWAQVAARAVAGINE